MAKSASGAAADGEQGGLQQFAAPEWLEQLVLEPQARSSPVQRALIAAIAAAMATIAPLFTDDLVHIVVDCLEWAVQLDARDGANLWYRSAVTDTRRDSHGTLQVNVHYIGWSRCWDDWLSITGSDARTALAPAGTMTWDKIVNGAPVYVRTPEDDAWPHCTVRERTEHSFSVSASNGYVGTGKFRCFSYVTVTGCRIGVRLGAIRAYAADCLY
jgi:hypothetical protein